MWSFVLRLVLKVGLYKTFKLLLKENSPLPVTLVLFYVLLTHALVAYSWPTGKCFRLVAEPSRLKGPSTL